MQNIEDNGLALKLVKFQAGQKGQLTTWTAWQKQGSCIKPAG